MLSLLMASLSAIICILYAIVWILIAFQSGKVVFKLHWNLRLHICGFITTALFVFIGMMILAVTIILNNGSVNVRTLPVLTAQCFTGVGCHALRAIMFGACFERYIATVKGDVYGTHNKCYFVGIIMITVEFALAIVVIIGQIKYQMPLYITHIEMVVIQIFDITCVRYLIRLNRQLRRVQCGLSKNYHAVQNLRLLLIFEPHIIIHSAFSILSLITSVVAFNLSVPWLHQMLYFYLVYCIFFLFDGLLALWQLHRVKIVQCISSKHPKIKVTSIGDSRNIQIVDCFGKIMPTAVSSESYFTELQKSWR